MELTRTQCFQKYDHQDIQRNKIPVLPLVRFERPLAHPAGKKLRKMLHLCQCWIRCRVFQRLKKKMPFLLFHLQRVSHMLHLQNQILKLQTVANLICYSPLLHRLLLLHLHSVFCLPCLAHSLHSPIHCFLPSRQPIAQSSQQAWHQHPLPFVRLALVARLLQHSFEARPCTASGKILWSSSWKFKSRKRQRWRSLCRTSRRNCPILTSVASATARLAARVPCRCTTVPTPARDHFAVRSAEGHSLPKETLRHTWGSIEPSPQCECSISALYATSSSQMPSFFSNTSECTLVNCQSNFPTTQVE